MIEFKCVNKDCERYNKVTGVHKAKWIWNPKSRRLESDTRCSVCDRQMEEVKDSKSRKGIPYYRPYDARYKHSGKTIY